MTGLVLLVKFADGRERAVQSEPDTIAGRHAIDRAAFSYVERSDVESAKVTHVEETRTSRRSYR